jgi:hypothetical protein
MEHITQSRNLLRALLKSPIVGKKRRLDFVDEGNFDIGANATSFSRTEPSQFEKDFAPCAIEEISGRRSHTPFGACNNPRTIQVYRSAYIESAWNLDDCNPSISIGSNTQYPLTWRSFQPLYTGEAVLNRDVMYHLCSLLLQRSDRIRREMLASAPTNNTRINKNLEPFVLIGNVQKIDRGWVMEQKVLTAVMPCVIRGTQQSMNAPKDHWLLVTSRRETCRDGTVLVTVVVHDHQHRGAQPSAEHLDVFRTVQQQVISIGLCNPNTTQWILLMFTIDGPATIDKNWVSSFYAIWFLDSLLDSVSPFILDRVTTTQRLPTTAELMLYKAKLVDAVIAGRMYTR